MSSPDPPVLDEEDSKPPAVDTEPAASEQKMPAETAVDLPLEEPPADEPEEKPEPMPKEEEPGAPSRAEEQLVDVSEGVNVDEEDWEDRKPAAVESQPPPPLLDAMEAQQQPAETMELAARAMAAPEAPVATTEEEAKEPTGDVEMGAKDPPGAAAAAAAAASIPGAMSVQGPDTAAMEKEADEEQRSSGAVPNQAPPPPGPAGAGDPANRPAGPQKTKSQREREMNPRFKDVKETGKWGEISRKEVIGVSVAVVVVVIVVIIVVVVLLVQGGSGKEEQVAATTSAPTPASTALPPSQRLKVIIDALQSNSVTSPLLSLLSEDADFYQGKAVDDCAQPHHCAMSWLLYDDQHTPPDDNLVDRFALASMYYSLGGPNWSNHTNWLNSSASVCQWYGMECALRSTDIQQFDLSDNKLVGTLPEELALLEDIEVISLKGNKLEGTLPANVFLALSKLFILYVNDNQFTGTIPDNLDEGKLVILFIHENNFTGPFPENYCTGGDNGDASVFEEMGLDCAKNPCVSEVCCTPDNCF